MLLAVVKVTTHPLQTTVNIYLLKPHYTHMRYSYKLSFTYLHNQKMLSS